MCIAVPMRIVEAEGLSAVARREGAPDLKVDTSLVGELAPGDWVLVFRESVIRTVSEEEAERIGRALACVSAVMAGGESAAAEAAGMSKPTSGQIQYIDLSGSDSVTLYKADSSGALDGLLDSLERGWSYVLEYFR